MDCRDLLPVLLGQSPYRVCCACMLSLQHAVESACMSSNERVQSVGPRAGNASQIGGHAFALRYCFCTPLPLCCSLEEFYCALGVVALVPPFAERPDRTVAQLAWAGAAAAASGGNGGGGGGDGASPGPSSPEQQHKQVKQS